MISNIYMNKETTKEELSINLYKLKGYGNFK